MWNYTDNVMDHFRNPRNFGKIEENDGMGQVGSLACGDALKLMFKLDAEGRIEDVKFQTFGCASAIASSSALTEMIKGKTLEEAETITNKDIADFLGGLPDQKMHCSVMGREALEAAIHNYRTGEDGNRVLKEEKIVCHCFGVSEQEVLTVVRDNNLTTVDEVTNYCKAGGGCGMCQPDIAQLIEQVKTEQVESLRAKSKTEKLTNLQKIKLIQETMDREVRPMLQRDGGDAELIDVNGNTVLISFRGMCAGCHAAEFTMKDVIEAKLREFVSDEIIVEESK